MTSEAATLHCLTSLFTFPGPYPPLLPFSPACSLTSSRFGQKSPSLSLSWAFRQGLLGCNPQEGGNFVIPTPPTATAWECPPAQVQPRDTGSTLGCGAGDKASLFHGLPPWGPTLSSLDLRRAWAAVPTKCGFADEAVSPRCHRFSAQALIPVCTAEPPGSL